MIEQVEAELLSLFKANMSSRIAYFYQGEVIVPNKSNLPCLMVWGKQTQITAKDTCNDQFIFTLGIRVVNHLMKYVADAGTGEVVKAQLDIKKIFEEMDSVTNILKEDTVLGSLRSNIKGVKYLYNTNISASYEAIQTGEFFYVQGECELEAYTDLIKRPPQS